MPYQAIIETGGRQFAVAPGDIIHTSRLSGAVGDTVTFSQVLALRAGDRLDAGRPHLPGAQVAGEIIAQDHDDKVLVFRFRRRVAYRRKVGHRQPRTTIRITGIHA